MMFMSSAQRNAETNRNCGTTLEQAYNPEQLTLIFGNHYLYMDCFRICDECGKPMIEGYVVDGCDAYCSDECLHKHLTDKEFDHLYNDGSGDTYWTTWYEDSITYNKHK